MRLYAIDIETVTQGKRANGYTDQQGYKLGNVKDPIKVEAKLEEKRLLARDKHALTWWTGKIISVAIVDVFGVEPDAVYLGHNEEVILEQVAEHLKGNCKVIGKSSDGFDVPYMVGRYMANMKRVPGVLKRRYARLDVDNFFGYSSQSGQRGKLNDYAHGVAYAGKPMKGSDVAGLYLSIIDAEVNQDQVAVAALWKQLRDYNLHDANVVKALATLYYRDIEEVE